MKKRIRLTESDLHNMVKESLKKVLNEEFGVDFDDTLAWVKKKNPTMSPKEQEKFANNIINKRKRQNSGEWVYDRNNKVHKLMWALKKSAQETQKFIDIANPIAKKIRDNEIPKEEWLGLAKKLYPKLKPQNAIRFTPVFKGEEYSNCLREDGWPIVDYIYDYANEKFPDNDCPSLNRDYSLKDLENFMWNVAESQYVADADYRESYGIYDDSTLDPRGIKNIWGKTY